MSKEKGFVQISAKGLKERIELVWKILRYGKLEFDYELFEDFAKSYIEAERKKHEH